MPFDSGAYLRLEAPQCITSSSSGLTLATSTGDILEVSSFGAGIFRLRMGPHTRPDYGLVVGRAKPCNASTHDGAWRVAAGEAMLEISGAPLRFRLFWRDALVSGSTTDLDARGETRLPAFGRVRQGGQWTAAFALASGEPVYGLGEKFGALDKRGELLHSWVQDAGGVNTGLAYKETPFAWSPGVGHGAWGVFVHTPGAVIHGVGHPDWSHRSYGIVVDDEALDLFLFVASEPADLLAHYAEVTGRASSLPLWSFGTWIAQAPLASVEEATASAARLRERRIPCDVLALEGGTIWDPRTRSDFEWRGAKVRAPAESIAAIKREGFRVALWTSPYVSVQAPTFDALATQGDLLGSPYGGPYVMSGHAAPGWSVFGHEGAPDAGFIDFTNAAGTVWWKDAHATWFGAGVDAIHADCGEHVPEDAVAANGEGGLRLHNVYPLLYQRAVQDATAHHRDPLQGAPVVLARASWTGGQRVALPCGGDAQWDWEGLAASIRGALSWGMSGGPLSLAWAGGSYGVSTPDPELALRWLQAAVFASHLGVRGAPAHAPWSLGPEAEAIARKWLAFRYRLVPYLRAAAEQSIRSGLPVMRAMALAFGTNPHLRLYETQFLCGDALLVAPIVKAGGEVDIAFPPGGWFDLNSRQRIAGPRLLRYRAKLDQFPVFGREGYALPLGSAVQHTGEIRLDAPLEQLWVFGAAAHALEGFAQARIQRDEKGGLVIETAPGLKLERFGDRAEGAAGARS